MKHEYEIYNQNKTLCNMNINIKQKIDFCNNSTTTVVLQLNMISF